MEEKKLTGYPSIDKPWLKHYTEKWSKDLIPQKTVYRNIYDNNINYKNDIAIIFNGFKTSYAKMFTLTDKYAKALKANGIEKGAKATEKTAKKVVNKISSIRYLIWQSNVTLT